MDPFVAEIRIFPFNFAPKGWAFCDGQILPLSQNTALFSLLGTTYGGDGKSNFALPNMQGNAPMHPGQGPGCLSTILERRAAPRPYRCSRVRSHPIRHALRADSLDTRTRTGQSRPTNFYARSWGGIGQYQSTGHSYLTQRQRASPRRRRPAAQQHAALPDAQLLHRVAGRLPSPDVGARWGAC